MTQSDDEEIAVLPDHLLVEVFVRLPINEWVQLSCVSKHWASVFHGDSLWHAAISRTWPSANFRKRWPGPIPRGSGRRRYTALHASEKLVAFGGEIDELVGHTYLYLKEQLELPKLPPPSSILHGTIIDQFIACGNSTERAHELTSKIWLAVLDNLEESEHTFSVLKRLAQEDLLLPYPYSRPDEVLWRVFDKLFTDYRDCFNRTEYYDALANARSRFHSVPSTWLGL